jgi:hypothetical protein
MDPKRTPDNESIQISKLKLGELGWPYGPSQIVYFDSGIQILPLKRSVLRSGRKMVNF